jgi:hypothetical protein
MPQTTTLTTLTAAEKRIRQLGDTMYNLLVDRGECTRDLLRAEGFSTHELDTYADAARTHANSRFVRTEHYEGFTKTDDEIVEIAVEAGLGLIGDAQIFSAMLGRGLTAAQIDRNWQKITRRLGLKIGTLPKPQPQRLGERTASGPIGQSAMEMA